MRISLIFGSVFGHVGIFVWSCCIFVPNFVQKFNMFMLYGYISSLRTSIWPQSTILDLLEEVLGPSTKAHL